MTQPGSIEIVLYESGSRGGNFEYSKRLFEAYKKNPDVGSVDWIVPVGTAVSDPGIYPILCDDRVEHKGTLGSRVSFIYRSLSNPLRLLKFLRQKKSPHFVILNDFEQLTALFWVPLYKFFLKQHYFAVVLHDPDRDAYPPSRQVSSMSMKSMMSIMSLGLYHEQLPDKPYYQPNEKTEYLAVPHGLYDPHPPDQATIQFLEGLRNGDQLLSIIGNIRMEKNYEMAIWALSKLSKVKLVIAGAPSSSSVDVDSLRKLAFDLNVSDRVIFLIEYLSDNALSAVIHSSDVILLNYKNTFTSQSGIFNLIAPFKKSIVVSRTDSGLAATAARFGIGHFVEPGDQDELVRVLKIALQPGNHDDQKWNGYIQYASWENHVNIVVDAFKKIKHNAL